MEKKEYQRPELVEYGNVAQLTLGANGPQFDFFLIGGALVPDNNAPNCSTNSWICVQHSS
jgi:hypothetical protein